jgi:hypothetical protein
MVEPLKVEAVPCRMVCSIQFSAASEAAELCGAEIVYGLWFDR